MPQLSAAFENSLFDAWGNWLSVAVLPTGLAAGCLRLLRLERASCRAAPYAVLCAPRFSRPRRFIIYPSDFIFARKANSRTLPSRPKAKHHCSLSNVQCLPGKATAECKRNGRSNRCPSSSSGGTYVGTSTFMFFVFCHTSPQSLDDKSDRTASYRHNLSTWSALDLKRKPAEAGPHSRRLAGASLMVICKSSP